MKKKSLKWVGSTALSLVLVTSILPVAGATGVSKVNRVTEVNGTVTTKSEKNNVYVESEFATLKRVVLTQSEAFMHFNFDDFPEGDMPMPEGGMSIMNTDPAEAQKKWEKEREDLKKVLEKYGVEVQRPRLLNEKEKQLGAVKDGITGGEGVTNFFVRDPFFTIGNHLIEGSFKSAYRRLEVLPVRSILDKEAAQNNVPHVAVPQPDVSKGINSAAGPYLEGGDILVYGKTVFVGNSGLASNKAGIDWLRNYLTPSGYKVVEVKLEPGTLHLDCAISFVRDGLMIVSMDSLANGLPEELKNWDKIEVSYKDAQDLAVNGLPISSKVYVTDIAFKNTIGKELEKRGIKVEYVDYEISRSFGGAFRCSTQPLLRTDS
ncbi:arginine deiminase family protein [Paenibacillus sp. FSL P4-0176]|uniref:dimethylarginine dimethylaminohydrolase family protein n=1 Tax=Paenibacillus sp. FSL P4-0176 TaxID=2921631 RepID=UPI0030CE37D3